MRTEGGAARREACVAAGYLLLAVLYTGLWSDFGSRFLPGNDAVADAWILNTITRNLLENPLRPFEGNLFYPSHNSALFSDPLLGPVMLVLPLRLFTAEPALLYNAALLLGLTLASYGFYRLGLRLFADPGAALLAGIAIPYCAQQMHHLFLSHLAYLSIHGFPFLWMALLTLLARPGPLPALAAGVAFAWQAGTGGYYAFCSVFLCLLVAAWSWRRFGEARTWLYALRAGVIGTALMLPYVLGFLGLREEAEVTRGLEWPMAYSADLGTSFLRSNGLLWGHVLTGRIYSRGGPLFPGLLVLVFAAVGFYRGRGPYRGLLALVAVFFLVLAFGPQLQVNGRPWGPMPFKLLRDHLPLISSMRHPTTFAVPAQMALVLAAVSGLALSGVSRRPWLLTAVLLGAVAETLVPTPRRDERGSRLPEVYTFLRAQPRGGVLELPFEENYAYQWWAIRHGLPVINGETAFEPRRYAELYYRINREWDRMPPHQDMEDWASVAFLKGQFPIRYLVLHPGGSGYVRVNVEATRRTFEFLHETADGDRVYRVGRGGTGTLLKRRFRDDQLKERRITGAVRGPQGAVLAVSFNDVPLERRTLGSAWETVTWTVPPAGVVRGLNTLRLDAELDGAPTTFELQYVEADPG